MSVLRPLEVVMSIGLIDTIPFDDYDENAGGKLPQVFRSADAG